MRDASPAAQLFFASRAKGWRADLFTVTLADGTIYRWTSFERDVTYGSLTWIGQSPNLERVSMQVRNTSQVPDLEIKLSALDSDFAGGANIKLAMHQGAFNGARIDYAVLPIPTAPNPTLALDTSLGPPITLFGGRIGELQITATGATIKVRGDVVIMSQYAPRNDFQTSCQHRFCDPGCTLSQATNTTPNCDVGFGSSTTIILWGGTLPGTPTLATNGQATFTTGPNAGHKRTIISADATSFTMAYPLWFTPVAGDLVDVFYGCVKTMAACVVYGNLIHYRGFPSVPDASYSA